MKKIRVAVLGGGFSSEREVSIKTAQQVAKALPKEKYQANVLDVSKNGKWFGQISKGKFQVAFIALHGQFGEDGKIQAILDFLKIPYTGSGVLARALGMDKIKCLDFLRAYGISFPDFIVIKKGEKNLPEKIKKEIGFPCVVKPSESGSSIGVSITKKQGELSQALKEAFREGEWVMVQKYISGRELTCGVLGNTGNKKIKVLPSAEIIVGKNKFFGYEEKYFSQDTQEISPAKISSKSEKEIGELSVKIHQALGCDGLTRSDFILDKKGKLHFLEINTIPGQTEASLCPKEARAAGISFSKFIELQVKLALGKKRKNS